MTFVKGRSCKKLLTLAAIIGCFNVANAAHLPLPVSEEIEQLFDSTPIVDALMEPAYRGENTTDFGRVVDDTGVNVISGKLASPQDCASGICDDGFDEHVRRLGILHEKENINLVEDAGDLASNRINDRILELLVYIQMPWRIDFSGDIFVDNPRVETHVKQWKELGLRAFQLAYNEAWNAKLYEVGEHYAGGPENDAGLTRYGYWLTQSAFRNGLLVDTSHMGVTSTNQVINIALSLAERHGRPFPVLANHETLEELCDSSCYEERLISLNTACRIASTGGVIGITPIASTMLPPGSTFLSLVDQINKLRAAYCPDNIRYWNGKPINMIDHIAIASDANVNGTAELDSDGDSNIFFLDEDASSFDRWKMLATALAGEGYTDEELKKIFGGNILRAYRHGLEGDLPFEPHFSELPPGKVMQADFNGDGFSDFTFHGNDGRSWIDYGGHEGNGLGEVDWDSSQLSDPTWCNIGSGYELLYGDFNGDGRSDRMCKNASGKTWIDFASSQGAFEGNNWHSGNLADPTWCPTGDHNRYIGDFNGDGRDDILCHSLLGKSYIDYASTNGSFTGTNWSSSNLNDPTWCNIGDGYELLIGDFNGDGRDDRMCKSAAGKTWVDYANSSGEFLGGDWSSNSLSDPYWCNSNLHERYIGDFNGDGRDDIACHSKLDGKVYLDYASTQGQFEGTNWWKELKFCMTPLGQVSVGDTNGDNRDDLVCYSSNDGMIKELFGKADNTMSRYLF